MLAYFGNGWVFGVDLLWHILELHDEEGRSTPDMVIWNKGSMPSLDIKLTDVIALTRRL